MGEENVEIVEEDVEETTLENEEELSRDTIMDQLAKKRFADLAAENAGQQEAPENEEQEEPEETADVIVEEEPEFVDLNIYGENVRKTKAEVDAAGGVVAMQKTLAADKKFAEVAKEREELARLRQELEAKQPEPVADVDSDKIVDAFIESVYSGDEEQARDSFKKALSTIGRKNEKPVDEGRIVKETLYRIDQDRGVKDFEANYSHLSSDPHLRAMVNEATARIKQATPAKSPSVIITEAAEEVDAWVNNLSGGQPPVVTEQIERKRSIKNIKSASTRQKQDIGYKPKTQKEIFAELKANRSR